MSFEVEIHNLKNFTEKQREKAKEACFHIEDCMNSEFFWAKAEIVFNKSECRYYLNFDNDKINFNSFLDFKEMVLSGSDKFNKESDGDLDLHLTMYHNWGRAIGYTYPSTWFTWINRKFFKRFDKFQIAGNIFHEYLHNLGLKHPGVNKRSLIYLMGYLVRDFNRPKKKKTKIVPWYKKFFTVFR